MTVCVFIHSAAKRAETISLLDSGATENFLNLEYAKWLHLPIKKMPHPWKLFNVDGTENKAGQLQYYTDLAIRTGSTSTNMWFFLTKLGEHKAILGYPWFAATQPKIDWKWGWINHTQLPIVLKAPNAAKAQFLPQSRNQPKALNQQILVCKTNLLIATTTEVNLPKEYIKHKKVFSKEKFQWLPKHTMWDHAIELLPGAPTTIPGRLLPLNQKEIEEIHKFIQEHLTRGVTNSFLSLFSNWYERPAPGRSSLYDLCWGKS